MMGEGMALARLIRAIGSGRESSYAGSSCLTISIVAKGLPPVICGFCKQAPAGFIDD